MIRVTQGVSIDGPGSLARNADACARAPNSQADRPPVDPALDGAVLHPEPLALVREDLHLRAAKDTAHDGPRLRRVAHDGDVPRDGRGARRRALARGRAGDGPLDGGLFVRRLARLRRG